MQKIYLILENGMTFEGICSGAKKEAIGEVVFTTGVIGYLDTLTDSTYSGQIVVQTFPLIGNYGINKESTEGKKTYLNGYVVKDICEIPSNFSCIGNLNDYLIKNDIVCISGIDTREITKIIREQGIMNGYISSSPVLLNEQKDRLKNYKVSGVLERTANDAFVSNVDNAKHNVVIINNGTLGNIVQNLNKKNCNVQVVPYNASDKEILALNPNGVVISSGGGNPLDNTQSIDVISKLFGKVPMLGIGLGHQMMALSQGAKCLKLKHGNHGANQSIKHLQSGKLFVMTKNQCYAIHNDSLDNIATITFKNINDGFCEGLDYKCGKAISVQFEPVACDSPLDSSFVYDNFIKIMEEKN